MEENILFKDLKLYKLDNGLTVILKRYVKLPIASVQLWVFVGSICETDKNNGISHFLEHLVFKGTQSYNMSEISKIAENYGGVINAGTSKDFTMYFIDIPKEGVKEAINILHELTFLATFPEEEVEKERKVVIEEIKRAEDNPENVLFENFNSLLFVETPYKYRILGKVENISSLQREEIVSYYKEWYSPENMVFTVVGDIDFGETEELVAALFGKYKPQVGRKPLPSLLETFPESENKLIKRHKVQHLYFLCGFLGPEVNSEEQYAGEVQAIILGKGRSSRLYRVLREEKKLVYYIDCGFYPQRGNSIFYIGGVCEERNFEKVLREIRLQLEEIKNGNVTQEELNKAKEMVKTSWYFNIETVHSQGNLLSWWTMFKNIDELKNYLNNIENVSIDDLKRFVTKYGRYLIISALQPERRFFIF
jgi:zinc protease